MTEQWIQETSFDNMTTVVEFIHKNENNEPLLRRGYLRFADRLVMEGYGFMVGQHIDLCEQLWAKAFANKL